MDTQPEDLRTTLDKLPSELILQIAGHSCPKTMLTLSRTCKSLRQTCYDTLVFAEFFEDRAWAKKHLLDHSRDVQLIARYALAEHQYAEFISSGSSLAMFNPDARVMLRYLPSLVMLDNPVPLQDQFFKTGRRFAWRNGFSTEENLRLEMIELRETRTPIALIFACGLLGFAPLAPTILSLNDEIENHNMLTFYTHGSLVNDIRNRTENYKEEWHSNCMMGAAKLASMLHCAFPDREKNENLPEDYVTGGSRPQNYVPPPLLSRIPIVTSPAEIPLPFLPKSQAADAWTTYVRGFRRKCSTPTYMDTGEWVGTYTYNNRFRLGGAIAAQFDAFMTGVRFKTEGPGLPTGGYYSRATGADQWGPFEVTLSWDEDGYMRGRKAYTNLNGHAVWSWYLSNTPFGLYGIWTTASMNMDIWGQGLGGAVWLWKRKWCEVAAEEGAES